MGKPELPRKKKVPQRLDDGAPGNYPPDSKTYHCQAYFEVLDLVVNAIQDRFEQPDFRYYQQLEELLMKTVCGDNQ